MTDQTVTLRIRGDATGIGAAARQASAEVAGIGAAAERTASSAERASNRTEGAVGRIGRAAGGVRDLVLGLGSAFLTLESARGLSRIADQYANMAARIRLATGDAAEFNAVQSEVFAISQRTSASLDSTVTLYTRLSAALRDAGASQSEVLGLTETINQALVVSGASAAEASGAVVQLSQALAAGALRGEEFNSVNEAAPRLMQALAASLGVTRGELRALAQEGALTGEVVREALSGEQAELIAAEYQELPLTIGRAFQQLSNTFTRFIGEIDQTSGASSGAAQIIARLSESIAGLDTRTGPLAATLRALSAAATTARAAIEGLVNIIAGSIDVMMEAGKAARDLAANYTLWGLVLKDSNEESKSFGQIMDNFSSRAGTSWTSAAAGLADAGRDIAAAWRSAMKPAAKEAAEQTADLTRQIDRQPPALRAAREGTKELAEEQRRLQREARESARSMADLSSILDRQAAQFGGPAVAAAQDYRDELVRLLEIEQQLASTGDLSAEAIAGLAQARSQAAQQFADAMDESNGRAIESTVSLGQTIDRTAEESSRAWLDFTGQIGQAFGDWITGGIRSFSDFGRRLRDMFKRMLADMVAQLVQSGLMRMLAGFFGGSVPGLAAAAGQGGFTSQLGAMFSGAGGGGGGGGFNLGGGGMTNSALSWLGNSPTAQSALTYAPYLAAAGGAAYGFQNRGGSNGSGGSLAATAAYGYAGYALGTVATGALLGAGAGAATGVAGAAAGGALAGGAGAAAAIPVVGWIVAALALIDAFSGGKLFGTRYKPDELTSSIGIEGGEAFTESSITEVRNRSLFRGRQWRTTALEDTPESIEAAQALFDAVDKTMTDAARQLRGTAPDLIDVAIRTVQDFDSKGRATTSKLFVDVLGRSWEEATQELAATRITAEAIISTIDQVLGTTVEQVAQSAGGAFGDGVREGIEGAGADMIGDTMTMVLKSATAGVMGEASAIAERWRDDAEKLLAGAQFLLVAAGDIRRGIGLLGTDGSLTAITDLIEDLQRGEETLIQTYQRVSQAAALLDQALEMSGVTIDGTREQIVRFAVEIADAAGGIERAQQLWSGFFARFYSDSERAALQGNQLQDFAQGQFGEIGLNLADFTGSGGLAAFRALFEEALPTLSADAVVQWLEAAEALGMVLDAQAQYNAAVMQAVDAQAQAIMAYEAAAQEVRDELDDARLSAFGREMRDINRWTADTTDALNAAARAAGFQAAAESDLAAVHQVAANRAAAAIARLRDAARQIVGELFGSPLDQINAQIEAIERASGDAYGSQLDGLDAVDRAGRDVYAAQLAALQNIQQWLDRQLLGDLSTLTPEQRIAEAERQFQATLAAAQAGDTEALQRITGVADALLREGRSFYASGEGFTSIEAMVRAGLQGLVSAGPTASPLGPNTGGSTGGGFVGGGSADLQTLYAERDRLLAQQEAERRAGLVAELAQMIRELIQATGQPLEEIAASIGVNLAQLAESVGINLQEASVETALGLANLARQLGVDVAELAQQVGVSLGELADRQSLLNQALDSTVADLPEEFRDRLRDPLEAIRSATNEADATDAIEALINLSRGFPAGIRDQLAPFLTGLDPSQTVTELGTLRTISDIGQQQLDVLEQILFSLSEAYRAPPRAEGDAEPVGKSAAQSVELQSQLVDETREQTTTTAERLREVERAVREAAETQAAEFRRLSDALLLR